MPPIFANNYITDLNWGWGTTIDATTAAEAFQNITITANDFEPHFFNYEPIIRWEYNTNTVRFGFIPTPNEEVENTETEFEPSEELDDFLTKLHNGKR